MDPLSVVASIIALLQLTNKVIGYLNDVKDASKERARCAVETSNLYSLLTNLRFRLEDEDAGSPWFVAIRALAVKNGPLDQFKDALELLQDGMTSGKSQLAHFAEPLVWKFKKLEIEGVLQSIERLKTLVAIALQMDHFKLSQAIKNDTGLIRTHISTIESRIESMRLDRDRTHLDYLRKWLSQTDFPTQQSDVLRRRREGTGQWFLDTSEFAEWSDTSTSQATLLCTGIPGAGKTMLAAVAIDYLLANVRSSAVAVAFLYCSYKSRNEQSIEALLAAVLQQLVQPTRPETTDLVTQLQERHVARSTRPSAEELHQTLLAVLDQFSCVYIVIDALDECSLDNGTRGQLLDHLRRIHRASNLRVLITSRHLPDIVHEFSKTPRVEIRAHDEDVKLFLAGELHRLPRCIQRDAELQQMVLDRVVGAIDGMFLLARLYIDSLMDKRTKTKVQSTLKSLSGGSHMLEKAYEDAVARLKSQLPGDTALAMRVLTYIVHAESALTTTELCHALAVETDESCLDFDNLPDAEDIVAVCAGLVAIDEDSDIIRLVHYTTYEYFETIRADWCPNGQLDIAQTCLTYLAFDVFKTGSCSTDADFERRLEENPFLDYAALHWGAHAMSVQHEVFDMACNILLNEQLISSILQAALSPLRRHDRGEYSHNFPKGWTGLHVVAELGLHVLAEKLLEIQSGEVKTWTTTVDHEGRTPLYVASVHDQDTVVKLLLDNGADPNTRGGEFDYALIAAVLANYEETTKLLLAHGANPNLHSEEFGSALQTAFRGGHQEMVRLLMDAGADLPVVHAHKLSALHKASKEGWHDIVGALISRQTIASLAQVDKRGRTALYVASAHNHVETAKMLLDKGVPVDASEEEISSPIHAAAENGHREMLELLLQHGADKESVKREVYPLQTASIRGHHEAVQSLLHHGASLESRDVAGFTALALATWNEHLEVAELLLNQGADINTRDSNPATPLHKAAYRDQLNVVLFLLEKGANVNDTNAAGWTPICSAASEGHVDVVSALLEYEADISIPNCLGWVPLTIAADHGYMDVVELLLPLVEDVNAVNSFRGPFLSLLARRGALDQVQLVQNEYKADLLATDMHGRNILHVAARSGHFGMFPFLQSVGIQMTSTDAIGDGMLRFAASSGNSETSRIVLDALSLPPQREEHWSPLHWACRAGNAVVVDQIAQAGISGHCVKTSRPATSWSPLDVLIFHGHEEVLDTLSEPCKQALRPRANEHRPGMFHGGFVCDGCDHAIMGARFKCLACLDFDYCFMCKPFFEHLHADHEWGYIEAPGGVEQRVGSWLGNKY